MISCVCPTTASRWWILPLAIECWQRQTYADSELLIVVDGPDGLPDGRALWEIFPDDARIRDVWLGGDRRLGRKYNECIEHAMYDWIVLWADDIWQAPTRLERAAELATDDVDIVADWATLTHDLRDGRTKYYVYPQDEYPEGHPYHAPVEHVVRHGTIDYLVSGTLMFRRSLGLKWPFPDVQKGSDDGFVVGLLDPARGNARVAQLTQPPYLWAAFTHGANVSASVPHDDPLWQPFNADLEEVMGGDLAKYQAAYRSLIATV